MICGVACCFQIKATQYFASLKIMQAVFCPMFNLSIENPCSNWDLRLKYKIRYFVNYAF